MLHRDDRGGPFELFLLPGSYRLHIGPTATRYDRCRNHELQVLPLHLRTEQQRNEYMMHHGWQALATQWISLGAIVVVPGSATTVSLTLRDKDPR